MILGVEGYTARAKTSSALTAFIAHIQQSFPAYATGVGHGSCGGLRCPVVRIWISGIGGIVALSGLVRLIGLRLIGPLGPFGVMRAIVGIMTVARFS